MELVFPPAPRLLFALPLVFLCASCFGTPVALERGDWKGDMTTEGVYAPIGLLFRNDATPAILAAPSMGFPTSRVTNVREGETLRFHWSPDTTRECALLRTAGNVYTGDCTAIGKHPWHVRLMPPSQRDSATGLARGILARAARQWRTTDDGRTRVYSIGREVTPEAAQLLSAEAEAARLRSITLLKEKDYGTRLHVFAVRDRATLTELTGLRGGGTTDPFANTVVLTAFGTQRTVRTHEIMHAVSFHVWGPTASPWLREGVPTYAAGMCQGYSLHQLAAALLRERTLLPLEQLVHHFEQQDDVIAYLKSGSLVQWIVEKHGVGTVRDLWQQGSNRVSPSQPSLERIDAAWRAALNGTSYGSVDWSSIRGVGCG